MGDLAITDELAVYKQVKAGVNTLKIKHRIFAGKLGFGEVELAHINCGGVFLRYVRRIKWEGIDNVRILRNVISASDRILPA